MSSSQSRRTFRKKYGGSKRNAWTSRKKDFQQDKQIVNIKKSIRKINSDVELKHADSAINNVTALAGTFYLLNGVAQDTTASTDIVRQGDEIVSTSVQVRGYVEADATITTTNTGQSRIVRMILFWDGQPNGSAPTLANLLDLSVITDATMAPYNLDYYKRFKVLKDRTYALNANFFVSATNQQAIRIPFRFRKKLSRKVKYSTAGGTITAIQTNSLYLVTIVDDVGNSNVPLTSGGVRYIFKDL